MITIVRTSAKNKDFIALVKKLDTYLKVVDGNDHSFYNQYNGIENIKYTVVAYENGIPVGCGAIKQFDEQTMEVKRMFTSETSRGKGIASKILQELELWTAELNYKKCILETGLRQTDAVHFYKKNNYQQIDNYGQYIGIENSICFEKNIN